MAIVEYDEQEDSFKAINSWGENFAQEGYFHIQAGLFKNYYYVYQN